MSNETEVISTGKLEALSAPELVKLHNELDPENPTKRFSSREAGIKRIIKLLAARASKGEAPGSSMPKKGAAPTPEPTPAKEPKQAHVATTSERGRKPFNLEPRKHIKPHREGTKRDLVSKLLSRANGATFEQVQDATGWSYRDAYEGIKLLHVHCGYGLREDEKGRIHLTTKENDDEFTGKKA